MPRCLLPRKQWSLWQSAKSVDHHADVERADGRTGSDDAGGGVTRVASLPLQSNVVVSSFLFLVRSVYAKIVKKRARARRIAGG